MYQFYRRDRGECFAECADGCAANATVDDFIFSEVQDGHPYVSLDIAIGVKSWQ